MIYIRCGLCTQKKRYGWSFSLRLQSANCEKGNSCCIERNFVFSHSSVITKWSSEINNTSVPNTQLGTQARFLTFVFNLSVFYCIAESFVSAYFCVWGQTDQHPVTSIKLNLSDNIIVFLLKTHLWHTATVSPHPLQRTKQSWRNV